MAVIKINNENDVFQNISALKTNRNKRHKRRAFFVEGVRNINAAIKFGWQIDAYIFSGGIQLSKWANDILKTAEDIDIYELTPALMKKLSSKTDTSEIAAIVRMRDDDYTRAVHGSQGTQGDDPYVHDKLGKIASNPVNILESVKNPIYLLLDRPSGKGNLGTIMRSCDVFGVKALFRTGHSVDYYDPEVVAASMGSLFVTPFYSLNESQDLDNLINLLRGAHPDITIAGTSAHGEHVIYDLDLRKPLLILIGNETDGLSWKLKQTAEVMAVIPMGRASFASSLNISCATTALLYEARRQTGAMFKP